ncbi:WG repeat-containing protein, partial [Achromobacter denitrificans]
MRAPLVLKPLALALAVGTLAAHGAAQARSDWIGRCAAGHYEQGAGAECQQPYQEGLAAVLTGSADDDAGAWGYLDKQGRMAIAPAYTDAESFQNGLAAVSQGERWGYIDRQGRWAIEPRYARATGFNAEGTALVEDDGRDVLIDRQGKVVKTFPLGTRSWGFQRGQKLAAMEMPQPPRLVNAVTGKAATLPEGVMRLAAPTGGYLPAQLRDTRYGGWWGLLDTNGGWAITPQTLQSRDAPIRDGDVIAVVRDDRWLFVDPRGQALSSARYRQLQVVAPGVWLAKTGRSGKAVLLDGKQKVLHRFASEYVGLQERDGWRYLIDETAIVLVDPADKLMTIAVGQGRVDVRDGEAWVSGAQAGNAEAEGAAQAGADASAQAGAEALEQAGLEVAAMPAETQDAATAAEPEAVEAAATTAAAAAADVAAADAAA